MAQEAAGWLVALLAAQGVLGGFDTLYNHEHVEHLPQRPSARAEIGLHSLREALYAALFGGLAWLQWHGAWAFAVGLLLAAETINTACDEFVENRTRVLPQNERVLHVVLTLNLGAILAVSASVLSEWHAEPTALQRASHGGLSWLLTLLAISGVAWSLRDFLAWRKLARP